MKLTLLPSCVRFFCCAPLLLGMLCSGLRVAAAADEKSGAAIYQAKCASCHGPQGQGTSDNPKPLIGDQSIRELKKVIEESMPDGEPEKCVGEEAEKVAAYIHEAFYSIIAQERNRPAKVEFSRLTVRQFENSVADVIGSFQGQNVWYPERGLHAEYFNQRSFNRKKRVIERNDPSVDFNFGEKKPADFPKEVEKEERRKDDIHDDEKEFSIKWDGCLLAPETGDYEFIVESENGVKLYVNNTEKPLFDAWVRSGDEKEYRRTIRLLGGRSYPIRLEFFRYKEPTSSIKLKWKPPHQAEEIIPDRNLSPKWSPGLFVLNTPFPPDDRSIGYERGTSVSKAWEDAVTMAAFETAGYVVDNLDRLARTKQADEERDKKIRAFCDQFVHRAFRRPLSDEEKSFFIEQQLKGVSTDIGVKRVVLLTLMSPRFLYREIGVGDFDAYDTASWLSFSLWDSIPDQQLLDAASKNQLQTREQIGQQVDRMLGDLRTRSKLKGFFHQWLRIDRFPELVKDGQMYPGFDAQLVSDLRTSLDLFLDDVVSSKDADFRRLLLDDSLFFNARLAKFYGAEPPADSSFHKVSLAAEARAGVLTHPLLLAGFAYDQASSPIHRGVFIARSLLGRRLKAPPEAVAPLAPDLHAGLSTRERVLLQTSPAVCQNCHGMINQLGFPLEHFDAAGRFRQKEKEKPIVASGTYVDRNGQESGFNGSRELAEFLISDPEVHEAFVEQLFQYTVKQPIRAFGDDELKELRDGFAKNNFHIQKLLREIIVSTALRVRELPQSTATASTQP